jgi:hypothetical protein
MTKYYSLLFLILFSSCGSRLNYLGSSYAPSKQVDVFVDASAIKKSYTIIGKGYMEYGVGISSKSRIEKMQDKAIQKARSKGADAILFQDYYFKENGTSIQTVTKTDSVGKSLVSLQTESINPVISSRTEILFLKYD